MSGVLRLSPNPHRVTCGQVIYLFTRDQVGSNRDLTSGTDTDRATYDYDPYGTREKLSGDRDVAFGYIGRLFHAHTVLILGRKKKCENI